jgi:serine/threonine protein kinase
MEASVHAVFPFIIDGRYRVESELGRGGMGVVYRGTQLALSRPVAIKRLSTSVEEDPSAVERFRREALAASRLAHPGIVGVFDAGVFDDAPYLVMELVEGEPLDDLIARRGVLGVDVALGIAVELANALGAAHAAGILHRDVKPANVLIATDGRARLVDFGLATLSANADTRITRYGMLVGTPEYLAPEIARGADPDPRGDVYALGATLYEMLTGALPFDRPTPIATILAHVHDDFVLPSRLVPTLDTSIDALIGALMAREPALRPRDGRDTAIVLEALIARRRADVPETRHPTDRDLDARLLAAFAGD